MIVDKPAHFLQNFGRMQINILQQVVLHCSAHFSRPPHRSAVSNHITVSSQISLHFVDLLLSHACDIHDSRRRVTEVNVSLNGVTKLLWQWWRHIDGKNKSDMHEKQYTDRIACMKYTELQSRPNMECYECCNESMI